MLVVERCDGNGGKCVIVVKKCKSPQISVKDIQKVSVAGQVIRSLGSLRGFGRCDSCQHVEESFWNDESYLGISSKTLDGHCK